jgi:hypothetical protein
MHTLGLALRAVMIRASVRYHANCVERYWNASVDTHADMSAKQFDFYAERIADLLGQPHSAGRILDYGAGRGEIGIRLRDRGFEVEFSELSRRFMDELRAKGLVCIPWNDLPPEHYDAVFANNSVFYVHPRRLLGEIERLLSSVAASGRLLLLDVPVLQRCDRLPGGPLRRAWWRATQVVQPEAGGFFIDQERIVRAFPCVQILDSWASYRVHFEIRH